jgi:protein ImuB
LRKLADDLVALLERQARGARRIELILYRVDGHVRRIPVGASRPLNEARAIARLFAERLASPHEDAIDAGYGVDLMRLACLAAEPLAPSQAELERAHEAERAHALAGLLDRLSARLGARAVTRRELIDAHLPEQAEAAAPATLGHDAIGFTRGSAWRLHVDSIDSNSAPAPSCGGGQGWGVAQAKAIIECAAPVLRGTARPPSLILPHKGGGDARARGDAPEAITNGTPARPLRLFARPEPIEAVAEVPDGPPLRFRWRRVLHNVAAIEGPERIAAPWWRGADAPTRDYFRAEDTEGRRFWLYREGLIGRETLHAKWFVHGLFG